VAVNNGLLFLWKNINYSVLKEGPTKIFGAKKHKVGYLGYYIYRDFEVRNSHVVLLG
jgi:hypothetical protein